MSGYYDSDEEGDISPEDEWYPGMSSFKSIYANSNNFLNDT